MAEKRESNLSALRVKLDVDCSEALKGLKAVTRAAKVATAAIKELAEHQNKVGSMHNPNAKEFLKEIISQQQEKKTSETVGK